MSHHDTERAIKRSDLSAEEQLLETEREALRNWRSWGSWFSWGSPVGLGLFIISIGVLLVLLHVAGLVGK